MRRLLFLFFLFAPCALAQSNTVPVQTTACQGSGTFSCTIPATGSGHGLTVLEKDFQTTTAPSAPTVPAGDVFTVNHISGSGYSVSTDCSASTGTTSVTIHATGDSAVVILELSGGAASNCVDVISPQQWIGGNNDGMVESGPIVATQTDFAIGLVGDGVSSASKYTCPSDWTHLQFSPQTSYGGAFDTCYIPNGIASQFSFVATVSPLTQAQIAEVLIKSAVAGTPPANSSFPTVYVDSNTGVNGAQITPASMLSGSHGQQAPWSGGGVGMTYTTNCATNPMQPVTVNGRTYTTSALAVNYDLTKNGSGVAEVIALLPPSPWAAVTSFAADMCWPSGEPPTTFNHIEISGGSSHYYSVELPTDDTPPNVLGIETDSGDSAFLIDLTSCLNTVCHITGQFSGNITSSAITGGAGTPTILVSSTAQFQPGQWVAFNNPCTPTVTTGCTTSLPIVSLVPNTSLTFGTPTSSVATSVNPTFVLSVYNAAGVQVGPTVTHTPGGSNLPIVFQFGRTGSECCGTGFYQLTNFEVDGVNGVYPLGLPSSGLLNSTRVAPWSRSGVGVTGGIPTYPPCTTAQAGTTVPIPAYTGTGATITNALTACAAANPSGSRLPLSGAFNISDGITFNNLNKIYIDTIGGPLATSINFTGPGVPCFGGSQGNDYFCVKNANGDSEGSPQNQPGGSDAANWTGGFTQGATSITVANVGSGGISNGDVITLDQTNDTTDNGGFIICDNNGGTLGPNEVGIPTPVCMGDNNGNGNVGRSIGTAPSVSAAQQQRVTVVSGCATACVGAGPFTLTITPGLYANNWNQGGKTVGVWFVHPNHFVGIQDITLKFGSGSAFGGAGFQNESDFWVKNVAFQFPQIQGVFAKNSSRCEIRDSYFYAGGAGTSLSYGINVALGNTDCLIENDIFQQVTGTIQAGGSGMVYGYNFAIDDPVNGGTYNQSAYVSHDNGNLFSLWEENEMSSLFMDQIHGTSGLNTIFRNWLNGRDWNTCQTGATCTYPFNNFANHPINQTNAMDFDSYSRGMNVIGNVLGTPGYHVNYAGVYPASVTAGECNLAIYQLGYGGTGLCGQENGVVGDPLVGATMMRWGNYDVTTGAVQWNAGESSPAAVTYIAAQSTPSTHVLPASLYLSSVPSFFNTPQGALPFPLNGPDVTGGNGSFFTSGTYAGGSCPTGLVAGGATCPASNVGGYANLNPAANCYFNVLHGPADGSGGPLAFDASLCYGVTSGVNQNGSCNETQTTTPNVTALAQHIAKPTETLTTTDAASAQRPGISTVCVTRH